jgi:predicted RNase H-like nuclease (RuvC/YqgF family)
MYAEYWKQSMLLGQQGIKIAEQEKTRADTAVREVTKYKEEANKHKEENDRLQEKTTRLEDEAKTLRDEVDRLKRNLQNAEERDNIFRRRVKGFLQEIPD